jgi:RimJ/RimL family protein N-acetyltransferase
MTTFETQPAVARPSLATARLRLSFPLAADAPAVARHADDPDVARNTTGIPIPYSLEQAEAFVARAAWGDPAHEALFAVRRSVEDAGRDDDEAAETIGLLGFHINDDDEMEVGYWLGRPFWGFGYMGVGGWSRGTSTTTRPRAAC